MSVTVLITRPEPAAIELADTLRGRWGCGVNIVISPVMQIEWAEALPDLSGVGTLIFTSRNGVAGFARLSERRDLPCYAVGSATAEAARALGLVTMDAEGDADALVDRIRRDAPTAPCLHLRGEHAAGDVAQRLTETGIETREAVLYRQKARALSEEARACLGRDTPVILPLYSPRSAALCFDRMDAEAPLVVAAISANAAKPVPDGSVIGIIVAQTPDAEAMLTALDAAYEMAIRVEGAKGAQ
ncbi:uroporphyrinogen-III synthase [Roseovarius faecimaris]|nr:uroporphyrinogen-III synthase [Roseovarius faecimaris]